MKTSKSLNKIFLHILAWSAFIFYEISVVFFTSGPKQSFWWTYAGYYTLHILLFYANAHLVLYFSSRNKHLLFLLTLLVPLELAFYIQLQFGLENLYNLFRPAPLPVSLNYKFIIGYTWRGIYFIGLSTAYWFVLRTIENTKKIVHLKKQQLDAKEEKLALEKNLVQTQNAYLQAQINPHLLFNTLNFIYNKVQDVSPPASEGVLLLSEVMRHALAPVHADGKTDLHREIEHIEKYIALNQIRFGYPLYFDWQVNKDFHIAHRIPPLVLLTFIENMFHHGDLTNSLQPAKATLYCVGDTLHFQTANKKRRSRQKLGHGIGVQNARTRLDSFYGQTAYTLQIQEDDGHYMVQLKLELA
ncbi:sensor histidine kinase [Pontibacter sp. MBLB2868]|uniref:sensor histidine kinase n=1 Tax=Pontibacter sp. MBLB2868 TaxID=3451555 RepID=UPI003F74D53F